MSFEKLGEDGKARRGRLTFPRGTVETPAFMPVGTYGTVKGMLPRDIEAIGAQIILGNTFHLMLRPGTEVVKAHGDLHDFTQWQGPILTDSGGFQVFSLGEMRKITEQGGTFRSDLGTYGTVKGMLPRDIEAIGAQIILGNTFHLMLRPGTEVVKAHGDLHDFTQWQGPILTDSGGFQVFSLGEMRKITEQGVTFR